MIKRTPARVAMATSCLAIAAAISLGYRVARMGDGYDQPNHGSILCNANAAGGVTIDRLSIDERIVQITIDTQPCEVEDRRTRSAKADRPPQIVIGGAKWQNLVLAHVPSATVWMSPPPVRRPPQIFQKSEGFALSGEIEHDPQGR